MPCKCEVSVQWLNAQSTSLSWYFLSIWQALAQDAPAGIVKNGSVAVLRGEGKSSGTEFTIENLVAGSEMIDIIAILAASPATVQPGTSKLSVGGGSGQCQLLA